MMQAIRFGLASALLLFVAAGQAQGEVITFENFAPPGGLVNVKPASPYSEAGFRLTPTNASSAVFDATAVVDMPGNTTDFFGFAESNIIRLTNVAGVPFNLSSLLLGPTTVASGPVTMTLVGNLTGGGSLTTTFSFLTTATPVTLSGFTNLTSVVFSTTDDAGIDNINVTPVNAVPEPSTVLLFGTGLAGVTAQVRKRRRAKKNEEVQ